MEQYTVQYGVVFPEEPGAVHVRATLEQAQLNADDRGRVVTRKVFAPTKWVDYKD